MPNEEDKPTPEEAPQRATPPASNSPEDKSVRPYDFRRPRRLSAEQVRNLQRLHAAASEQIQQRLSRYLGVQCEVKPRGIEEMDYGAFAESMGDRAYTNVLDLSPIVERGLFLLDVPLCLAFVDRMLGGRCKAPATVRPLTAIDQAAAETAVEAILRCLRDSWKEVYPMKMAVLERKNDIQHVRIVPRGEPVLVVSLDVSGDPGEGQARLVLPLAALKSATDTVARKSVVQPAAEKAAKLREIVMRSVERARLPVVARLGTADAPLRGLANLQAGDILRLNQAADSPVLLSVSGRPAFLGRMGLRGRKKAVQITQRIGPDEEE
jgi:flagellar motor switch protein FliM